MGKVRKSKKDWRGAVGGFHKPRRLKLKLNQTNTVYRCPITQCEHVGFRSKRGCRKHVSTHHGWYYYFDSKPSICDAFPEDATRTNTYELPKRSDTQKLPCFNRCIQFSTALQTWLKSDVGGGKSERQSLQVVVRVLKYLKFCCPDVEDDWEPNLHVIDFCLGSVKSLSDFINELREKWLLGYSGSIGYVDAVSHALDYRRLNGVCSETGRQFAVAEIFTSRIRKSLSRKMRLQWHTVLTVEHMQEAGCWATLQEMKQVIPFHQERFDKVIHACENHDQVSPNDISFCTAFITALLFLEVKASRPMTYQYLTTDMVSAINTEGFIDQTTFKTNETYGYDSLYFDSRIVKQMKAYIKFVRQRINPKCPYVLLTRNGTQHTQLCHPFCRTVYAAIGKYIHPTRLRQIIETESAISLSIEEQEIVSTDQKHSSQVAKMHYKKMKSRTVSIKSKQLLQRICDGEKDDSSTNMEVNMNKDEKESSVTAPHTSPHKHCKTKGKEQTNQLVESETEDNIENAVNTSDTYTRKSRPKRSVASEVPADERGVVKYVNGKKSKIPFTQEEDSCLKKGITKYGIGQWTKILRDDDYPFNPIRQAASLMTRAKVIGLIN